MNNIDRILHSNRAGRQQGDRGEEVSVSHTLTGREFGGSDKVQNFMSDGDGELAALSYLRLFLSHQISQSHKKMVRRDIRPERVDVLE